MVVCIVYAYNLTECAFPDFADEWKPVSVFLKKHLKASLKSQGVGAIQKWCNRKTKSIRSQNPVLKCDDCDPKSNVRKLTAIHTATKTSKSTTSHTATKAATMADSPFILDQKCNDCDPNSNVRKSARQKLSMVESDIDISKIKLNASNTSTKTTKSTASHTATKTSKSTASHTATKVATTADGPFNWKKMLDKLHKACSYDKIVRLVHDNVLPPIELNKKYQQSSDDKTDPIAMHFFPNDHPPNVVPTHTLEDGNCFPWAVSNALFRTQNRHVEIHVWLVFEAVLNKQLYLSNEYLSLGVEGRLPARPNLKAPSTTVVSRYCLYSGDDYVTGLRMSVEEMQGVYRHDIVKIGRKGGFMGIWQFHQAAEIAKNPICGVYPDGKGKVKVNANLRLDMNRVFLANNHAFHNMRPIYIMWTPVSVVSKAYDVNHFVVLLEPYR